MAEKRPRGTGRAAAFVLTAAASVLLCTWWSGVASGAGATGALEICKSSLNGASSVAFDFVVMRGQKQVAGPFTLQGGECTSPAAIALQVSTSSGPIKYRVVETQSTSPSVAGSWVMVTANKLDSGAGTVTPQPARGTAVVTLDPNGITDVEFVNEQAASQLKICKTTSDAASSGKRYSFTVDGTPGYEAIANGACAIIGVQQGARVTVVEQTPQNQVVQSVTALDSTHPKINRINGSIVKATIGAGINVLTFDNEPVGPPQQGNLEICKVAADPFIGQIASFHFTITDGSQTFTADVVPGQCSGPINGMFDPNDPGACQTQGKCGIPAGTVTVTETIPQDANWQLTDVELHAGSVGAVGNVILANGSAQVVVPVATAGEVTVDFTNASNLAPVKVCKYLTPSSGALTGKTFTFDVTDSAIPAAGGNGVKRFPVSIVAAAPDSSGACVVVQTRDPNTGKNVDLQVPVGSTITATEVNSNPFIDAGNGGGNDFTTASQQVHAGINELDVTNTALGQLEVCKLIVPGDPDYHQTFTFDYVNTADPSINGTVEATSGGGCSFPRVVPAGTYKVTEDLSGMTVTLADGTKVPEYQFVASDARNNLGQSLCTPQATYPQPGPPGAPVPPPNGGCGNPMTVTVPYAGDPSQGEAAVTFWNQLNRVSIKICKQLDPSSSARLQNLSYSFTAAVTINGVTTTYGPFVASPPYPSCAAADFEGGSVPFGNFPIANADGSPITITVTEAPDAGSEVQSIGVSPGTPVAGSPDLAGGTVTFTPGVGPNVVTYTNTARCGGADGNIPAGTPGTQAFYDASQPAVAAGCAVYVVDYNPVAGTSLELEFIRGANTGTAVLIGSNGPNVTLSDLAMTSGGTMYGVDLAGTFYTVDPVTGLATAVATYPTTKLGHHPDALVVGPTGTVYANESDSPGYFDTIDPSTGVATFVGNSAVSSGDLAFLGNGTLVMTVIGDTLYQVNPSTGASTPIGPVGAGAVYGLVGSYGQLFGFDVFGNLLQIDPATGAGTVIATGGPENSGAASPPNHT